MPRYEFPKPGRAALLDQLVAAGFDPLTVVQTDDTHCWITCAAERFDAAAAVVAAFDPAALDAQAAQAAQQDAGDRDTVRQAVTPLLADAATLSDTTVTLTAAQQRAMLARTGRAVAALARTLRRAGLV